MSQVALIVRLGLLVRSAAAGLEALREFLGRWECPGRITSGGENAPGGLVAPGLGCSVAGGMPWGGGAKMRGGIRRIGRGGGCLAPARGKNLG